MKITIIVIVIIFFANTSYSQRVDSVTSQKETPCSCYPSVPIEIISASVFWGYPAYEINRLIFDEEPRGEVRIIPTYTPLILLMYSLGISAELTSNCKVSYWNALWIGFLTESASLLLYGILYGIDNPLNKNTFYWGEYLALGILPSVASTFLFNNYLHCSEKKDQSMFLFPSLGGKNTASLNLMMRF